MKKNKMFKLIASLISALLIIIGIFVPGTAGFVLLLIGWTLAFILGIIYWIKPSTSNTKLKFITLIVLYLIALSWVIPAAQYKSGTVTDLGIMRMSIYEAVQYPYLTLQYFLQPFLYILFVGGFYGVLSETGKYRALLEKIAKLMKGKEVIFLILSSIILTVLSSLIGLNLLLFIIIPPICGIILLMGYDRLTSFLVGFVSTIIGIIGSTYSLYIVGYINDFVYSAFNTEIVAKIALLAISYILFIAFTIKHAKDYKASKKDDEVSEEREDEVLLIGEKKTNKKPIWPIVIVTFLILVLIVLGVIGWSEVFDVSFFTDLHTKLNEFEIFGSPILNYVLLEGQNGLGTWFMNEPTVIILIGALLLSRVYNLKFNETVKSFGRGVKKVLKPAVIVTLAYTTVIITAYHPYIVTVTDWMFGSLYNGIVDAISNNTLTNIVYVLFTGVNTSISTILNIDMLYVVQSTLPIVTNYFPDFSNSLAIITQSIYGLTLLFAPTSTMLLLGLEYLGIPYKEWLRTSWKFILELLLVILIIILVVIFV